MALELIVAAGKNGITHSLLCGEIFPGEGRGPRGHNSQRLNRSLQKLRKEGKIHYYSPAVGWRPGKATPEALGR